MWSIWRDGVEHRLDDVPLGRVLDLEQATGASLDEFAPRTNAVHARALAELLVGDTDIVLDQIRPSTNDLPTVWDDGNPRGGRVLDVWLARLTRFPYAFTPHQIRTEFTLRDLQIIGDASA